MAYLTDYLPPLFEALEPHLPTLMGLIGCLLKDLLRRARC